MIFNEFNLSNTSLYLCHSLIHFPFAHVALGQSPWMPFVPISSRLSPSQRKHYVHHTPKRDASFFSHMCVSLKSNPAKPCVVLLRPRDLTQEERGLASHRPGNLLVQCPVAFRRHLNRGAGLGFFLVSFSLRHLFLPQSCRYCRPHIHLCPPIYRPSRFILQGQASSGH